MIHFQNFHNIMMMMDSYKVSHPNMMPKGLTHAELYTEARGGKYEFTLNFGMNYFIKSYLVGQQVTEEKIVEAREFWAQHFGSYDVFPEAKWRYILEKHNGYLPIRIKSVKEGSIVPVKQILNKIEETDENCAWLPGQLETLLMKLWYPISVASNSMYGYKILEKHSTISGTNADLSFNLHCFGYRGTTSEEQAWIGGAAHILTFNGSDTPAGIRMLQKYYNAPMCAFSIPASEHSIMSIEGRLNERKRYIDILKAYPTGLVAIVSDTYNIYEACEMIGTDEEIRRLIENRDGRLIIRPDSGTPVEVLSKCLDIIEKHYGSYVNEKGYKVLNDKIRFIWGDGISIDAVDHILTEMEKLNWSMDNFAFGGGKEILMAFNRDTIKFAIKCNLSIVNGEIINVYKDPITGSGKTSKFGDLDLIYNNGYETINRLESDSTDKSMLETVFENGLLLVDPTYDEIIEHYQNELKRTQI